MMKQKTKTKVSEEDLQEIERKLVVRLKWMAYVFFALTLAALLFAFFAPGKEQKPAHDHRILLDIEAISGAALFTGSEISAHEIFNFYAVSLVFFSIGISLFTFSFKKTKLPNSELNTNMPLREAEEE
jgi:hypothetical protein